MSEAAIEQWHEPYCSGRDVENSQVTRDVTLDVGSTVHRELPPSFGLL
jgi:hypothetical protein